MFGISGAEFLVLLVVAAVVLGPERLPQYTQQLGQLIRQLRRMAQGATEQVRAELGPEFDDIDWRKLDPRQYDPRRIVRDALSDTLDPDDPLGLGDDPLGVKDKPLSRGGPGERARSVGSAPGSSPGSAGSSPGSDQASSPSPQDAATPSGDALDGYDPDAT